MKSTVKNIIIGVLILAAIIAVVWLLPPRPLFAILLILQIITLLAIGGTNININANGNHVDVNANGNHVDVNGNGNLTKTDHEQEENKVSRTGEEEA